MASADTMNRELNQAASNAQEGATQVTHDITNFPAEVQYQIKANLNKAKTALTEFGGSIGADTTRFVFNCYMWATLGLVAFFLGELAGKSAFHSVVQGIFGSSAAAITFGILVPLVVWGGSKMLNGRGGEVVLGASMVLGLLLGAALHGRRMDFMAPPPAILPLSVACAAYVIGLVIKNVQALGDRRIFVPLAILPAIMAYIVLGPKEASSSYMVYFALLALIAVIDVQVKLEDHRRGTVSSMPVEQWKTVVVLGIADQLVFWLMSRSTE